MKKDIVVLGFGSHKQPLVPTADKQKPAFSNQVEETALIHLTDTYEPVTTIADADELMGTQQLLNMLYQSFGQLCTSYQNLIEYLKAEGFTLLTIDNENPKWLLKAK